MKKLLLVKWKYINTSELEDYKLIDINELYGKSN